MIGSTITTSNTAFLLNSTVFVGSPPDPAPDQQGGGIWVRGVGGQVDMKSSTNSTATATYPAGASGTVACSQQVDEAFDGVQLGSDIAKLNINGWNIHLGATAGVLEARGNLAQGSVQFVDPFSGLTVGGGPFTSSTEIPFFGGYAAATNGGFSIDALLRGEYYQTSLNAPAAFLFGQNIDAHSISFTSSAAYQWQVPNSNWFIEPSAGIIISRTKVDPLNFVGTGTPPGPILPFGDNLSETLRINDIQSDIGRAGLRVGTTIDAGQLIWQPFAAVSVWHEFGPNITSTNVTCPNCTTGGAPPALTTLTNTSSTSTFGTFGQYSLGVSAVLAGTGWLGFARVDYRDGPNLEGLSGTGGIRYQFTPEAAAVRGVMPVKAPPIYKAPAALPVNWTGFYVGGFGGATLGTADWKYVGGEVSPHIGGYDAGGDLGYNWQNGRWVFGVEGEIEKTSISGGTACAPLAVTPAFVSLPMFQMTCNAQANWLATATARVGYTWDRALFYVKAGGAWTDERFSATCNDLAGHFSCTNPADVVSTGFTASTNGGGWVIGYGVEFALTQNWSAKAETDYISFGDTSVTASDGSALNVGMHLWESKIGFNYRFNAEPLVARY